jgi:ubiquinone/menaquinone biosynthesis C-methylase UbiE
MSKDDVNPVATEGFQKVATIYEQARPSYPSEVIDLIKSLYNKPDIIIDLGAGTGKLTRLLGPIGAREIIAIEPVPAMRESLTKIPIITKIIDGTAEHIPFEDNTIDIIVCGQSFHWFANHDSLAEINRVLKPNGLLVLVWNTTDDTKTEWVKKISEYINSFNTTRTQRYQTMEWKKAFDNQNFFSSLQYKQFTNTFPITRDIAMNRILSTSFIAILPSEQQTKLIDEVGKMLDNVEEIRDKQEFDAHYLTDVYWCSPLKSSSLTFDEDK